MTDCVLCSPNPGSLIWKGRHFYALDAGSEDFPAFIRIVAQAHVPEVTDLAPEVRRYLWSLLETAEETMRAELSPDKMNWAQFGNMVPHLHWHLTARWRDDGWYPECPWGTRQRAADPEKMKARRAAFVKMLPLLAEKLAAVPEP